MQYIFIIYFLLLLYLYCPKSDHFHILCANYDHSARVIIINKIVNL